MEKFYLEKPSMERKDEIIEYLDEFKKYNSAINGTGGLNSIYKGKTIEEALDNCIKMEDKEYAEAKGFVQGSTYFLIRKNDNKIVGMFNLRHYLNDYLKDFGGHIGYGIRPTERRKGYAKLQLYFALLEAQKLGIEEVMIDCIDDNIGSEKTIQALGGVFEKEIYEAKEDRILHNYWINVNDSIEKYKDTYEEYIIKNKTK